MVAYRVLVQYFYSKQTSQDSTSTATMADATIPFDNNNNDQNNSNTVANIVVIGCGWWSQGWHIPQLFRNEQKVRILALIDTTLEPKSSLNPNLESLDQLSKRYSRRFSYDTNASYVQESKDDNNNENVMPIYTSVTDFLKDTKMSSLMDGAIIATPHSSHYIVCELILEEGIRRMSTIKDDDTNTNKNNRNHTGRPISILMEKPMTTDVYQAYKVHEMVQKYHSILYQNNPTNSICHFYINHSANFRSQAVAARKLVMGSSRSKTNDVVHNDDDPTTLYNIGTIRHIHASFASPLLWIFDDINNRGWNEIDSNSPTMIGNGFAWGQCSHILAWIFYVCNGSTTSSNNDTNNNLETVKLQPQSVFCTMNHSVHTGADVSHSATIICNDNITFSLSGTTLLPGNTHSDPPVPKEITIEIFGEHGTIQYSGNDRDATSGKLLFRKAHTGEVIVIHPEFHFENLHQDGLGPESLQTFIDSCIAPSSSSHASASSLSLLSTCPADSFIGLQTVQTIEAMYRSNQTKQVVPIHHLSDVSMNITNTKT